MSYLAECLKGVILISMKIYCNRNRDLHNIDFFVGKDYWVKVLYAYNSDNINAIYENGEVYYFKFLEATASAYVVVGIAEHRLAYNMSTSLLDEILSDECYIDKNSVELVKPLDFITTEELISLIQLEGNT